MLLQICSIDLSKPIYVLYITHYDLGTALWKLLYIYHMLIPGR